MAARNSSAPVWKVTVGNWSKPLMCVAVETQDSPASRTFFAVMATSRSRCVGEDATRIGLHEEVDRGLVEPVALQARHKVAQNIAVPEAPEAGQHHLEEDILGEQDAVAVAHFDEADKGPGILLVRGALGALVGIVIIHADHVVLEERAALGEARLVGEVLVARVHVAEDRVPEVSILRLNEVEDLVAPAFPAREVDGERHAGDARST